MNLFDSVWDVLALDKLCPERTTPPVGSRRSDDYYRLLDLWEERKDREVRFDVLWDVLALDGVCPERGSDEYHRLLAVWERREREQHEREKREREKRWEK